MKPFLIKILLVFYLILSIGINVSVHYCGNEVASVSVLFSNSKKCGCAGKESSKGCCQDKEVTFQIAEDQYKVPEVVSNTESITRLFLPSFVSTVLAPPTLLVSANSDNTKPPNALEPRIYLRNAVFRI